MTQLEINLETTMEALKVAHEAGVTTIFNPGKLANPFLLIL